MSLQDPSGVGVRASEARAPSRMQTVGKPGDAPASAGGEGPGAAGGSGGGVRSGGAVGLKATKGARRAPPVGEVVREGDKEVICYVLELSGCTFLMEQMFVCVKGKRGGV